MAEEAREGFEPALQRMRGCVQRFAGSSNSDIRQDATIEDAKLVYARELGFEDWETFCQALEEIESGDREAPSVAFIRAVEGGDVEMARMLLEKTPDLANCRTSTDKTALHSAMNVEMASLLIERGASLDVEIPLPGGTPLMHHLVWGSDETAEVIAGHSLSPGNLRVAAGLGRIDLLERLLPEPGQPTPEACARRDYYRPNYGWYPWMPSEDVQEVLDEALSYAARNGRMEAAAYLVEHGADVNGLAYESRRMLYAAWKNRIEMIEWLLDHGAEVDGTGWLGGHVKGATALHLAGNSGHLELAKLLVARGADPTLRDPQYNGPPDGWAHHHNHPEVAAYLKGERDKAEHRETRL